MIEISRDEKNFKIVLELDEEEVNILNYMISINKMEHNYCNYLKLDTNLYSLTFNKLLDYTFNTYCNYFIYYIFESESIKKIKSEIIYKRIKKINKIKNKIIKTKNIF